MCQSYCTLLFYSLYFKNVYCTLQSSRFGCKINKHAYAYVLLQLQPDHLPVFMKEPMALPGTPLVARDSAAVTDGIPANMVCMHNISSGLSYS